MLGPEITCVKRNDVCCVLKDLPVPGVELTKPVAVVLGSDVPDDDAAVGGGEPEVTDPTVLVGGR